LPPFASGCDYVHRITPLGDAATPFPLHPDVADLASEAVLMGQYQVTFIGESDLPEGHNWALVRQCDGEYRAFVKRDSITPAILSECWEAFAEMERAAPATPPPLRVPRPTAPPLAIRARA